MLLEFFFVYLYRIMTLIECFGYFGSLIVVISFAIKDIRKLRILNIIGCCIFVVYGSVCGVTPVVVTNVSVILMHTYRLYKST